MVITFYSYNFPTNYYINNLKISSSQMNSIVTNKVNQMLWERKRERKKVNAYRNKRIKTKFEKIKQQEERQRDQMDHTTGSIQDRRKIDFYNQVFKEGQPQAHNFQAHQNRREGDSSAQRMAFSHNYEQPENAETWGAKTQKQFRKKGQFKARPNASKDIQDKRIQQMQNKAGKLKERKKKFIKKLEERTKNGQPVMKNYIKYALTKIEESMVRQKISEAAQGSRKTNNASGLMSYGKQRQLKGKFIDKHNRK